MFPVCLESRRRFGARGTSLVRWISRRAPQQIQAVGEIRSHSERIHALGGENLRLIGHSREQGEQLRQLGGDLRTTVQAFRL